MTHTSKKQADAHHHGSFGKPRIFAADDPVPEVSEERSTLPRHSNSTWNGTSTTPSPGTSIAAALPSLASLCFKAGLGVTLALYILNQKHLLPRPMSSVVSRVLFWPTLPIIVARRLGTWETVVDETVIMGGAPFGFAGLPEKLYEVHGVRGVVNLCEEYPGPIDVYKKLGMRQLHLPTTDHFEPTVDDMATAVQFIAEHQAHGKRVYVHCRAGHGRSAAVVLAWLIHKQRPATMLDVATLNRELCHIRNVRKTLWKQRNMVRFHSRIRKEDEIRTDGMEDSE